MSDGEGAVFVVDDSAVVSGERGNRQGIGIDIAEANEEVGGADGVGGVFGAGNQCGRGRASGRVGYIHQIQRQAGINAAALAIDNLIAEGDGAVVVGGGGEGEGVCNEGDADAAAVVDAECGGAEGVAEDDAVGVGEAFEEVGVFAGVGGVFGAVAQGGGAAGEAGDVVDIGDDFRFTDEFGFAGIGAKADRVGGGGDGADGFTNEALIGRDV